MRQDNLESFDRVLLQIVVGLYRGDGWPEGYSVLPPAFPKFSDLSQLRDIHPMAVSAGFSMMAYYSGWQGAIVMMDGLQILSGLGDGRKTGFAPGRAPLVATGTACYVILRGPEETGSGQRRDRGWRQEDIKGI